MKELLVVVIVLAIIATPCVALAHEEYIGAPEMIVYSSIDDISLPIYYQVYLREVSDSYNIYYEGLLAWLFVESSFNSAAIHNNKNGSYDFGLTQINSEYIEWYESLARKYGLLAEDEFLIIESPTHQIKLGVAGLLYYRDYWRPTGLDTDEIFIAMYNSYNMGIQGYLDYARSNGTARRDYDKKIVSIMRDYEVMEK